MPITSSAKKALRASKRKRVYNLARKSSMDTAIKAVKKFALAKKTKEAHAALPAAYKAIDKAVKANYLKKNAGARKKSRLSALIKRNSS